MLKVGALVVRRKGRASFPTSTIELLADLRRRNRRSRSRMRDCFSEIEDKSRQLAEASQHKSQFLANMSHELRTPLNAIIGVTEMLREDAEALKQDIEPLDRVLGAGRHLLALINDILDLSKIEAGRMELHLEPFPLLPLIDDVAKTIEPMAAKNGNRIVVDCPANLGTMHADQTRFRQTLLNLASNANKFTENGTVTIAARPAAERWPRLDHDRRDRHRHRDDARSRWASCSRSSPRPILHDPQIRRHRPWPCDQPALLPDDGRRHHGGEQAGRGLDLHDPPAADRARAT